ncbi:MAG: hypothetical protein L6Q84_35660 [Polyangiaceae bacterium]|jgi:hypothetical protein|nr:hypothetical protein [Polyangiaceae bacterium]
MPLVAHQPRAAAGGVAIAETGVILGGAALAVVGLWTYWDWKTESCWDRFNHCMSKAYKGQPAAESPGVCGMETNFTIDTESSSYEPEKAFKCKLCLLACLQSVVPTWPCAD